MASSVVLRVVLVDILIASPSVLAISGVKSLLYGALSLQILRRARWARTSFTVLFAIDAVDTFFDAWLLIGNPLGVPHVPLLVTTEIAFDAIYAYAVFLLFSEPGSSWFGDSSVSDRPGSSPVP